MSSFADRGSQRWLQIAVNRKPQLLLGALRRSGAVGSQTNVEWRSPLESDEFREYRDQKALDKVGIANLKSPLESFWPPRGPVWDALGIADNLSIFIEAKAHIPEAASGGTRASEPSKERIDQSLSQARHFYAPQATADWSASFYQYANRLAHHYFLTELNHIPSALVFLYFVNADDMLGPTSEAEWHGAARLIHAALGLPNDLASNGVFDAFLDARLLQDLV